MENNNDDILHTHVAHHQEDNSSSQGSELFNATDEEVEDRIDEQETEVIKNVVQVHGGNNRIP